MVTRKTVLLVFASLLNIVSLSEAQKSNPTKQNETISIEALQPQRVIGRLGQPLGSIVRLTGVSVSGDETRRKADSGQTLLRIETVNGKQLKKSVYFTFRRAAKGIEKPTIGLEFDYYIHEWGSFDGVVDPPKELGIEEETLAHDGFHYRPEITIHKAKSVQRDTKQQRK